MSPSPDRSTQPSKSPLSEQTPDTPSLAAKPDQPAVTPSGGAAESADQTADTGNFPVSEQPPLVPKRPLMRPVSRPQSPPTVEPTASVVSKVAAASLPKPEPADAPKVATTGATTARVATSGNAAPVSAASGSIAAEPVFDPAIARNQPIPPPSEPKQYRAIGLVRGRYTSSEEQFTRGTMVTKDGTVIEAVLLGRVMSLVRNHLDLEQEHLWVVYPRTRDTRQDLHVQIVGVWEPERLSKPDSEAEESPEPEPTASVDDDVLSPGYQDDYFSIRGEIVFHSVEEEHIIVKIQQAPRKSSDKAKAFKLRLEGALSSPKLLGYFWDIQVERRETSLYITGGSPIGLIPPKKKSASDYASDRRPPRRNFRDARPSGGRPPGMPPSAPPVRREPLPKPVKRAEGAGGEG